MTAQGTRSSNDDKDVVGVEAHMAADRDGDGTMDEEDELEVSDVHLTPI